MGGYTVAHAQIITDSLLQLSYVHVVGLVKTIIDSVYDVIYFFLGNEWAGKSNFFIHGGLLVVVGLRSFDGNGRARVDCTLQQLQPLTGLLQDFFRFGETHPHLIFALTAGIKGAAGHSGYTCLV